MSNIEIIEQIWISFLIFIGGLVLLVFFLRRLLAWLDKRGFITYTGHVPTYHSLGNAFLQLQNLAEPQKQYVIEMKEFERQKREEDDQGGPDKAGPAAAD